jgi:hypothetical protein
MTTAQSIEKLGWSLEHMHDDDLYRAVQGNFKTLWRNTPEQVLEDVKKIKRARAEPISGQH